jgi:hypothetical protein
VLRDLDTGEVRCRTAGLGFSSSPVPASQGTHVLAATSQGVVYAVDDQCRTSLLIDLAASFGCV